MATSNLALIASIRFQLNQLSSANGHHAFEHLARHLARARVTARPWARSPGIYLGWVTRVGCLTQSPALALTPDELALRIKAADEDARTADRKLVAEAVDGLQRATEALSGWTVQARTVDLQERRLLQVGAIAGAVGLALGLLLPLAVMRSTPHIRPSPEQTALRPPTRSTGAGAASAGYERLMG
jgi:hypothetical protein